jgi:hypothetical protein
VDNSVGKALSEWLKQSKSAALGGLPNIWAQIAKSLKYRDS